MRNSLILFLLATSLCSVAQSNLEYRVRKPAKIADYSLYYAATPANDAYQNSSPWTYFLFLPGDSVTWYLNAQPPATQNPKRVTGTLAGTFHYRLHRDTVFFSRSFLETNLNQTFIDSFTCPMYRDTMSAILDERVKGSSSGSLLYFTFQLYKPGK